MAMLGHYSCSTSLQEGHLDFDANSKPTKPCNGYEADKQKFEAMTPEADAKNYKYQNVFTLCTVQQSTTVYLGS